MAELRGLDISEFQGNPDFDTLKANADFVIIRAGFGTGRADYSFGRNQSEARRVGLLRGFYWYAYPQYNTGAAEADRFLDVVGNLLPGESLWLDFEESYGDPVGWSLEFLNRVKDRSGVKAGLYCNASLANGHDWSPVINGDYGLWIAKWDGSTGVPASPWPNTAMRQYADNGSVAGVSGNVDLDIFYGDADAFQRYGAQGAAPTPPPDVNVIPVDETINITADVLNVHTGPGTGYPVVNTYNRGQAHITGYVPDGENINGNTNWVRSEAGHFATAAYTDFQPPVAQVPAPPAQEPAPSVTPPPVATPPISDNNKPSSNQGDKPVPEVTPPAVNPAVPTTTTPVTPVPSGVDHSPVVKPGYKTTEFWLTLFAQLLPVIQNNFDPNNRLAQVFAIAGQLLALVAYIYGRSVVKASAVK